MILTEIDMEDVWDVVTTTAEKIVHDYNTQIIDKNSAINKLSNLKQEIDAWVGLSDLSLIDRTDNISIELYFKLILQRLGVNKNETNRN